MRNAFLLWVLLCISVGTPLPAADRAADSPAELLRLFYAALMSDDSQVGPNLFDESAAFFEMSVVEPEAAMTAKLWRFLRRNREAFLFRGIPPHETVDRARMTYVFTAFSCAATFFDGLFCVGLMAPASPAGKEGVLKEIIFGLQRNPKASGPRYLIDPNGIRINGVNLDPLGKCDRREELYRLIGIKPDQSQVNSE